MRVFSGCVLIFRPYLQLDVLQSKRTEHQLFEVERPVQDASFASSISRGWSVRTRRRRSELETRHIELRTWPNSSL